MRSPALAFTALTRSDARPGFVLDPARDGAADGEEARTTTDDSAVQAWVIPTNGGLVIAPEAKQLAGASRHTPYL